MSMINTRERFMANQSELKKELNVSNVMALPKIVKVSINVGLGQSRQNKDMVAYIEKSLSDIAGQKPSSTHAKKAISSFKIRAGDLVGKRVTLRGKKMDDFLNRLLNITLPRLRDFRGIELTNLDKQGSLTIGFKDQVPFAELGNDVLDKPFGLSMTVTVKNSDPKKSAIFLKSLGFPLKSS